MAVDAEETLRAQQCGSILPGSRSLKSVVHDDHEILVGDLPLDGLVRLHGELLRLLRIVVPPRDGLVDQLQADDSAGVLHATVLPRHDLKDSDGPFQVLRLLPLNRTGTARVIKSILGSGQSMTVDPDLHPSSLGPSDRSLQVSIRTFLIRRALIVISPEPNWYSNTMKRSQPIRVDIQGLSQVSLRVDTHLAQPLHIALGEKGIPVISEPGLGAR